MQTLEQLTETLSLDYRPADLGDTPSQFTLRLASIVTAAVARPVGVSDAEREAGARYILIGAQIRQTLRQAEEQKSASGASQRQDLATKLEHLRIEQAGLLRASSLTPVTSARAQSVAVSVEMGF